MCPAPWHLALSLPSACQGGPAMPDPECLQQLDGAPGAQQGLLDEKTGEISAGRSAVASSPIHRAACAAARTSASSLSLANRPERSSARRVFASASSLA